ncbi:putative oligopeptide transporter, OPT superfamily [Medicago truncatula]|uniref:Putative oligopeptide transporter, OPT superfamily n=1 Tax=Medicago truncatula TaxID=3880 RepID=A0A396IK62_MEDTR|nr:putative oligopeptide transporter, OPT superfamily [Medicago truncatula]
MQFFLIAMGVSFLYYALPGYLFTILTFFSWIISQHNKVATFTLDCAWISAYHGSPLVTPWSSTVNVWFPILSNQLFTSSGQKVDTTKILTKEYVLNIDACIAYNKYGKLYLSPDFALSIRSGFTRFKVTLTHVALFHGCNGFVWKTYVQLLLWGMLFAFGFAFVVTLPIGQPGYDIVAQLVIGYLLPGNPIANLLFQIYGRINTVHTLSFLSDLKLRHYMKILLNACTHQRSSQLKISHWWEL